MQELDLNDWNNKGDMTSDYAAFIIDHINMFKELDYKDDNVKYMFKTFEELYTNNIMVQEYRALSMES